ncbi:hypothetical protein HRW07_08055 [Streptomyces lunaelactis]|uniref:hypothetical protein n=1 Tax=Streptomyces lunaelactis TaxID=1535768 RepID=UPI001584D615|nr:hypothetical protein [Streptomyces lunaelactis]NUL03194.1 hypothetical protein [Streptomyces lunaelactis]
MSSRGKIVSLVAALVVVAGGLGAWLLASDGEADRKPLTAPAKPCWDGTPSRKSLQTLLGPGKKLFDEKTKYRVINDHWVSNCHYEALGVKLLDTVLNVNIFWEEELPKATDPLGADARPGDKATEFDAGVRAHYLRATSRILFQCDVDYPKATPAHITNDKYVMIDVLSRPMVSAGLTAKEARKTGLDIALQLANRVAEQAGCTNDTNLPTAAPEVSEVNWPNFKRS